MSKNGKNNKVGGQPENTNARKEVEWKEVDALLAIGCNQVEISFHMNVSEDTLARHCQKEKGISFAEYVKRGTQGYRVGLRRAQLRSANGIPKYGVNEKGEKEIVGWIQAPSVVMQIWLGKQYLDQKDKIESDTTLHGKVITGFNLVVDSDSGNNG